MAFEPAYDPSKYESDIYDLWEKGGGFKPKPDTSKGYFSLVAPPPNANGNLHIGHGLTTAIEDSLVRYNRLKGKSALFVPGADHAGFETQVVFERQLAKEGKSRFDYSREKLYQLIWGFVAKNRDNFEKQFRTLGASFDWDYFTFTLDDKVIKQAYSTFKKMWDEGLIYRGERLVNFCTFHGTAFADIEVEYKNVKGHLWHIKYPLTDGSGEVVVATTRPETMLGDTAVAVNPTDERYKKFIGKTIKLPLTDREIPILADEMVDIAFGTGAVKITPAHDPNDYDVAGRHNLPMISVISHEGKIAHDAPEKYRGLDVAKARSEVVNDLTSLGLLVKTEDYEHSVGHCYKCGTVIQPLLREQWFVDMKPLAKKAIASLKAGEISFYPEAKKDQLIGYLENLRDWNISRQIAWGIPIPAFCNIENKDDWIFDTRVDQEVIEVDGKKYTRDPDVFDTWFSSSSWPYATLNYPDGGDFKKFYPLSLMETGSDILYPWVSRMLMIGLYQTGSVPFKSVYLHGMIQDEKGQKMSKSKGNVIDPMDLIKEFGSDAFRAGIIATEAPGNNRPFDRSKIVGARNFANKLWNITRYIEPKITTSDLKSPTPKTLADHWILNKLSICITEVDNLMEGYRLAEAYDRVYHFIWNDFADWYLEASKAGENPSVLAHVLEASLKLAHPFAPFVTETIWQQLGIFEGMLINSDWPIAALHETKHAKSFDSVIKLVNEIRNVSAEVGISKPVLAHSNSSLATDNSELIKKLAKLSDIKNTTAPAGLQLVSLKEGAWIAIDDQDAKAYVSRLKGQIEASETAIKHLESRLSNKAYVSNAPETLVNETKQSLKAEQELLSIREKQLSLFEKSLKS